MRREKFRKSVARLATKLLRTGVKKEKMACWKVQREFVELVSAVYTKYAELREEDSRKHL